MRRHSTALTGNVWKVLTHYGIPKKLISIIQNSYEGMTCSVCCSTQWSTHRRLPWANQCETLLFTIAFPVPQCDWPDYETIHITKKKRNTMDIPVKTGRPGFCWWFVSPVPRTTADAAKDKYCGGTPSASRAEYPERKEQDHQSNSINAVSITMREETIEQVKHWAASMTHRVGQMQTLKAGLAK